MAQQHYGTKSANPLAIPILLLGMAATSYLGYRYVANMRCQSNCEAQRIACQERADRGEVTAVEEPPAPKRLGSALPAVKKPADPAAPADPADGAAPADPADGAAAALPVDPEEIKQRESRRCISVGEACGKDCYFLVKTP